MKNIVDGFRLKLGSGALFLTITICMLSILKLKLSKEMRSIDLDAYFA